MRLIRDGIVDREGVEGLASRLGYSTRQLNRLITAEVGTGPLALARAQRSQTARVLLETTDLPVAHVAFAAGFASVRQCNDTVRRIFADTPSGLRRRAARSTRRGDSRPPAGVEPTQSIRLRLPCRRPFDPASLLDFLATAWSPAWSRHRGHLPRSLRLPHGHGVVTLPRRPRRIGCVAGPVYLEAELRLADLRDLTTAVSRCRQLFDLDADPVAVDETLGADPLLGSLVADRPAAVCLARPMDSSSPHARSSASRCRSPARARSPATSSHAAGRSFPTPDRGSPTSSRRRRRSPHWPRTTGRLRHAGRPAAGLGALAEAVQAGAIVLDPGADPSELRRSLVALPGIGPWTAKYVEMRALRDPDAFMPTDLGIRRAAARWACPKTRRPDRPHRAPGARGAATRWRTCGAARRRGSTSLPTRTTKGLRMNTAPADDQHHSLETPARPSRPGSRRRR